MNGTGTQHTTGAGGSPLMGGDQQHQIPAAANGGDQQHTVSAANGGDQQHQIPAANEERQQHTVPTANEGGQQASYAQSRSWARFITTPIYAMTPIYWAQGLKNSWNKEGIISRYLSYGANFTGLYASIAIPFSIISTQFFKMLPGEALKHMFTTSYITPAFTYLRDSISTNSSVVYTRCTELTSYLAANCSEWLSSIESINFSKHMTLPDNAYLMLGDALNIGCAGAQLYNMYSTWQKYSEVEAITNKRDNSKFAVLGLQALATGITIANSSFLGALAGPQLAAIGVLGQALLHFHIPQVLEDRKNLAMRPNREAENRELRNRVMALQEPAENLKNAIDAILNGPVNGQAQNRQPQGPGASRG